MSDYLGLNDYYGLGDMSTGMVTDVTTPNSDAVPTGAQPDLNFRDYHWKNQQKLYASWVELNNARDTTSDLTNLCGIKEGSRPFQDDWFGVYPWRRRPRNLYPNMIPPNPLAPFN